MFVLFHSSMYVVDLMIYAISDFLHSKIIAQKKRGGAGLLSHVTSAQPPGDQVQ